MNYILCVDEVSDNMVNKNINRSEESQKSIRDKEKRGKHIKRLISIDREIDRITEEKIRLDKKIKWLFKERNDLKDKLLKDKSIERLVGSHYRLYCFDREELIQILDEFIQYKDYFENPPEEAFEVSDYDYSRCEEARRIEQLLYKYKIYDTEYPDKLKVLERRYDKKWDHAGLSREKLNLEGIFVILTWLHRAERHAGCYFYEAIKDGTFYNLLKRMEEIRNEL